MYNANQFQAALNSLNKRKSVIRENKRMIKEEMEIEEWNQNSANAEVQIMENPHLIPNIPKDYALRETITKLGKVGNYGVDGENRSGIPIGDIAKFMVETFGVPSVGEIINLIESYGGDEHDLDPVIKGARILGITIKNTYHDDDGGDKFTHQDDWEW